MQRIASKNAITQLSAKPDHIPQGFDDELKLFLNAATLKQFEIVQTQLHQKLEMMDPTTGTATSRELDQILIDDLTRDKQSILETAMRNARLERFRIESLLKRHASAESSVTSPKRHSSSATISLKMQQTERWMSVSRSLVNLKNNIY